MASGTIIRLTLLLAVATAFAPAQTPLQVPLNPPRGLPATSPTQPPSQKQPPTSDPGGLPLPQSPPTHPTRPEHRARVHFAGRTLEVKADNSSLNQILREIERVTGLKVTGGVTDERVYGTYGPAETSAVLTALLGGTGSNMLLIVDRNNMPTELVLTPRQGGPTPPSPNAGNSARDERDEREDPDTPPQLSQHIQRPPAPPPPLPATVLPPAQLPTQAPTQPTSPDSEATTTDQSPNGVKTPQQISEQLLKLQQQQVKPPTNP